MRNPKLTSKLIVSKFIHSINNNFCNNQAEMWYSSAVVLMTISWVIDLTFAGAYLYLLCTSSIDTLISQDSFKVREKPDIKVNGN